MLLTETGSDVVPEPPLELCGRCICFTLTTVGFLRSLGWFCVVREKTISDFLAAREKGRGASSCQSSQSIRVLPAMARS